MSNLKYKEEAYTPVAGEIALKLTLGGLHGGHSGVDIHLGRMNANKEMFRFLKEAVSEYGARLAHYNGGTLRNAIPREAEAVVTILSEDKTDFMAAVDEFFSTLRREYGFIEDRLVFKAGDFTPENSFAGRNTRRSYQCRCRLS